MFTIYAKAICIINFELAPAPFTFGTKYQIILLGIQFFQCFNYKFKIYNFYLISCMVSNPHMKFLKKFPLHLQRFVEGDLGLVSFGEGTQ